MELITGLTSGIFFIIYVLFVLLMMLFISSYLAAIILLIIPVLALIAIPEIGIEFLSFKQAEFLNGTVVINNLHILLFIWSALLSIIIYTELLSWYISHEKHEKKAKKTEKKPVVDHVEIPINKPIEKPKEKPVKAVKKPGQVNIPFKPLERFLQKLERMIGGNK
jgi:predicted membrane protein